MSSASSEWRVTDIDDSSVLLSSESSDQFSITSPQLPIHQQPIIIRNAANASSRRRSMAVPDRFAPLERFLEVGRQLQQQHQLNISSIAGTGNQHQHQQHQQRSTSHLRNKIVFALNCRFCRSSVCNRAMRAILLADTKVELYSTDIPPSTHTATGDTDRLTHGCNCRIRDTLCRRCGNVLGYHVSQPCERCLSARNNGHFWMFYSEVVTSAERMDGKSGKVLVWAQLAPMCEEGANSADDTINR